MVVKESVAHEQKSSPSPPAPIFNLQSFCRFVKQLADNVWRKPEKSKVKASGGTVIVAGTVIGNDNSYTSFPQFYSDDSRCDVLDLCFALDNFFVAYLEKKGPKLGNPVEWSPPSSGPNAKSRLEILEEKKKAAHDAKGDLKKCFSRRGMFERVILLAFGELRATMGDEISGTLKDSMSGYRESDVGMFEKKIAKPMNDWLGSWGLLSRGLKGVPIPKVSGSTTHRNSFIGPMLSLMYSPRYWDHNVKEVNGIENTRRNHRLAWEEKDLPKDVSRAAEALIHDVDPNPNASSLLKFKVGPAHKVYLEDVKEVVRAYRYSGCSLEVGLLLVRILADMLTDGAAHKALVEYVFGKGLMCLGDLESPKGFDGRPPSENLQNSVYRRPSFTTPHKNPYSSSSINNSDSEKGTPTYMNPQYGQQWFVEAIVDHFKLSKLNGKFNRAHEFVFQYTDIMLLPSEHFLSIFEGSNKPENSKYFTSLRELVGIFSKLKVPKEDENDFLPPLNLLHFIVEPSQRLMDTIREGAATQPEGLIGTEEFFLQCEQINLHKQFLVGNHLRSGSYLDAAIVAEALVQNNPSLEVVDGFLRTLSCDLKPAEVVDALLRMMPYLGWLGGYLGNDGDKMSYDVDMLEGVWEDSPPVKFVLVPGWEGKSLEGTGPARRKVEATTPRSVRLKVLHAIATYRKR